jgi:RNA polymerase sigma-B factor
LSADHAAAVHPHAGPLVAPVAPVRTTAILREGQLSSPMRTRRCDAERLRADRTLLERYLERRDPADREMLVERFLPLARGLARRYQRSGEPFDDLFQVACLGLVKAIDRFDLNRDVAFSSYAVPTILGEIRRYLRDRTWSLRVPRGLQELTLRVDKTVVELSGDLQRQPTVAEIARAVAATEEQVLDALQASGAYRATSLQTPRAGEDEAGDTLGDTLASTEPGFGLAEDRATLAQLLRTVTSREREVLRLRFEENLTQRQIGQRIGVSQMQTSRIIRHSIARLRTAARA